ncbi:FAD-binding oxidoreductase [Pseudoflavitalea sp. G-6-1-2]|uniref:NAD(P)/FAD-dependent oxidoreductase n=1 Tax=Pseudoflavitalea sp. G-6-1-2 TaxID=2728841 RepID=UPI00146A4E64|nr:FAD-dependent oxidoreductase [Pseudoflavitalea sp. G-6-1-2]NML23353.1 FAD-binding oxidoreductase [Pseudoflavitalea sp. G-6-1-2]
MQISVWEKESFFAPNDVVILGSGLVGLWCAWHLKKQQPASKITIIDRGIIPTGASTRNAGFACFGSVTELMADMEKSGEDAMLQLVDMRFRGLQRTRKILGEKAIGFQLSRGYEMITAAKDPGKAVLQQQMDYLNEKLSPIIGSSPTFRFAGNKIKKFGFGQTAHLLENKFEGGLHSGMLCQQLMQRIQAMGVTILNATNVTHFEQGPEGVNIYCHYRISDTPQSLTIKSKQLLVCTNAFAKQLLPDLDIVPARGQILVTSPIENLPFKGTFHYDEGFYYFRDLGDRILLGGARNKAFEEEATTEMEITQTIQQELENFLSQYIIPGKSFTITDRWSGIMGMGSEKMPIIKEVAPNIFCAVRMSGMGVALSALVGEDIAKRMA